MFAETVYTLEWRSAHTRERDQTDAVSESGDDDAVWRRTGKLIIPEEEGEDYKRIKTLLSFDMSETERKTSSRIIRDEKEEAIRRERGTE